MKRLAAVALAMLMLALCACSGLETPVAGGGNTQNGGGNGSSQGGSNGETVVPTAPQIDLDAPALALTVRINPEFEITLNAMNKILSVQPLNADAEGLFAALDVVGQAYHDGIKTVLDEAKTQGYLQDGAEISITVEEKTEDAWTVASERLLKMTIEEFQAENSISFTCDLTPAGKTSSPQGLRLDKTTKGEDYMGKYSCDFYYDAAGYNVLNVLTYEDGTRMEINFPQAYINSPVTTERIVITYYPDGSCQHEHYLENQYSSYTQYPDGTWETYTGIGNWFRSESSDGVIREVTTDGNGNVIDEKVTYPEGYTKTEQNDDGSTTTYTYHDNGELATENTTWPNGDYMNSTYREDGTMESYEHFMDGQYSMQTFRENGDLLHISQRSADGSHGETFYDENGNRTGYEIYEANGNYDIQTFYPYNGIQERQKTVETMTDGYYSKILYSESGVMVSAEGKDPSGNWYKYTYHSNGNPATYEDANQNITYYENGRQKRQVSPGLVIEWNSDGSYSYYKDSTKEVYFSGGKLTKVIENGVTYTDAESLSRYAAGFGITQ